MYEKVLRQLEEMKNNGLGNYIVPGLTSHLIGGPAHGKVRLFETERDILEFITPHSHRFNFTCLVLKGLVRNTIFVREGAAPVEPWLESYIDQVCGLDGIRKYLHTRMGRPINYAKFTDVYTAGMEYSMTHKEIHSIKFEAGTKVLFFEGPQVTPISVMIEPWQYGGVVPSFKTEDWMFKKL